MRAYRLTFFLEASILFFSTKMERHSFFTYLRLQIVVTVLRALIHLAGSSAIHRDRLLAENVEVQRKRIKIPSRERARFIEADVYCPGGYFAAKSAVLVNWHGSGFIFPLLGSDSLYCSRIARDTGITVLDVDYRKGPETSFPGPIEDATDTLEWVASQDRFDPARVGVSGFSAGGTIALVAGSSLNKELINTKIPVVIAIYPVTDLSISPEAKSVPEPRKAHPPFMQHLFNDCYVPDKTMRKNPHVSPSAADPSEFPPIVVILTCDGDIFEPEASALAERLDTGNRRVVHQRLKGVHHGFDKGCQEGTNEWAQREEAYGVVIRVLKEAMAL